MGYFAENIEGTIAFMLRAHAGQTDKGGIAYWKHPVRVTLSLGDHAPLAMQQTAILHDILEDTPVTVDDLIAAGFGGDVIWAVRLLTRAPDVTYADYIRALATAGNRMAMRVKLADLADNLDPTRVAGLTPSLRRRYESAREILINAYQPYEGELS